MLRSKRLKIQNSLRWNHKWRGAHKAYLLSPTRWGMRTRTGCDTWVFLFQRKSGSCPPVNTMQEKKRCVFASTLFCTCKSTTTSQDIKLNFGMTTDGSRLQLFHCKIDFKMPRQIHHGPRIHRLRQNPRPADTMQSMKDYRTLSFKHAKKKNRTVAL